MSSNDRLDVLRERNKELLDQLKQQREKLEQLSKNRKREREDPAEIRTRTHAHRGPVRASLAKPTVRFAATYEGQSDIRGTIPTPCLRKRGSAEQTSHLQDHSRLEDLRSAGMQSGSVNHSKQTRVTFRSDERDEISASDRHHLQPLLGYDWIAGVLDAEDSLIQRSDDFFHDLHAFRSLHIDECVHRPQAQFCEENPSALPLLTDKEGPEAAADTHQCTFSYRINSRLFPVPLHSQECCPVCKRHKSSHPHAAAGPALIRVTIPHSALVPPYEYKAHRRCSFDPSDSFGLPSHCLSGWSNRGQSALPPPSSLDLRNSLNMKQSSEQQDLSAPKAPRNQIREQISDVSRLARHNFQHIAPKRRQGGALCPSQSD